MANVSSQGQKIVVATHMSSSEAETDAIAEDIVQQGKRGGDRRALAISKFEKNFYLRHAACLKANEMMSGVLPLVPFNAVYDKIIVWVSKAYKGEGQSFVVVPMVVLNLLSHEMDVELVASTLENPLPNNLRMKEFVVNRRSRLPLAAYAAFTSLLH